MFEHALTFDDILLVPQFSEIVPSEVSTATQFAKNVQLNIPIISSAMDTVTESRIARILAQRGGLGVIHKNLSIAEQAFVREYYVAKQMRGDCCFEVVQHHRVVRCSGTPRNESETLRQAKHLIGLI